MIYRQRRSKKGKLIKLIILIIIIAFVVACYKVDFLRNNKYISMVIDKVNGVVTVIGDKASNSFSALVENYEPDVEDDTVYEVTDTQNRYYYNQLDECSKIIYAELLKNIDKIKDNEDNIKISSKIASLVNTDEMNDSLMVAFQNAWDAFRNDNIDIFYIDGTKMFLITKTTKWGNKTKYEFFISKGENSNYFTEGFNNRVEIEEAEVYVSQKEDEIIGAITQKNDYYKIVEAHNWIVDNLEYNLQDSQKNSSIYFALKDNKAVCEGYARLFKSLMDKMDIPCVFVSGEGINLESGNSENHAWNYVFLKGNWYAVDATWDDPIIIGGGVASKDSKYKYFLKGSDEFNISHTEDGKLVENGMEFKYPVISRENYVKEN